MKKKGELFRLSTRIINTPLLITPNKLEVILNVLGDRIGLDKKSEVIEIDENADDILVKEKEVVNKNIGVITIRGTLVQRSTGVDALSGLRSFDGIRKDLRTLLNDDKVDSILLDIDSGGGEVAGCFDLVDEIFEARSIKPIFAFSNESAFSAAFAIASAANKVFLTRTAGVGSIGVVMVHTDKSEANKKAGIKFTPIFAGSKKMDGSSFKPLSEKVKQEVQGKIDKVFSLFVTTVARNRNISEEQIRNMEAGFFMGEEAIEVGLADEVLNFDEVISFISNKEEGDSNVLKTKKKIINVKSKINSSKGGSKMDLEILRKRLGLSADTSEEEIILEAENLSKTNVELTVKNEKLEGDIEAGSVKATEDNKSLKELSKTVTELQKSNLENKEANEALKTKLLEEEKDKVIGKAVGEGKISPVNKEVWEKQYMDDPEKTIELIGTLSSVISIDNEIGNSDDIIPIEKEMTNKDKKVAANLGVSKKDYDNVPSDWDA